MLQSNLQNRNHWFWIWLGLAAVTLVIACGIGRYPLAPQEIWAVLTGQAEAGMEQSVLLQIRLPRVLFAALTGAATAVAGLVYQELFQNPLVSPDILGVSSGSCVGAVGAILLGLSPALVSLAALCSGLLFVFLTMLLARELGSRRSIGLILAGIVMKALADAAIMGCKYLADPQHQLPVIDYWLMGSFHTVQWEQVWQAAPVLLGALIMLYALRYQLQVLSFGDEEAQSLGIAIRPIRGLCIIGATLLIASSTAVTGVISWMGLLIPHMVRTLMGADLKKNFSICALAGAALMVLLDTAARSLTAAEIPISILTSALGALSLGVVLVQRHRRMRKRG